MTLRRFLLIGLLLVGTPVQAQVLDTGSITINSTGGACSIVASCAAFSLANATIASVTLQVSGTFTGTLTFEGTSDNTTWFTIIGTKLSDGSSATTTTATGQFAFQNAGLLGIRARATAAMTGTATVTAARGYATARWLTPFFSTVTAATVTATTAFSAGDGTSAAPSYTFTSQTDLGFYRPRSNDIYVTFNNTPYAAFTAGSGISLIANRSYNWSNGNTDPSNGTIDTQLTRPAPGVVAVTTAFESLGAVPTSGAGTGITVNATGYTQTTTYKVTIDKTAFICAAVTCDVTIATLAADTVLYPPVAKLTTTFACTATCTTATLSMVLGKGAGGAEYLASLDADASTAVFGDADAELGTLLVRAAAIGNGTYNTASQAVVLRLTSGTGFVGTGAATNLSQGSITIYLTTTRLP